jgi:hypothetical protein
MIAAERANAKALLASLRKTLMATASSETAFRRALGEAGYLLAEGRIVCRRDTARLRERQEMRQSVGNVMPFASRHLICFPKTRKLSAKVH